MVVGLEEERERERETSLLKISIVGEYLSMGLGKRLLALLKHRMGSGCDLRALWGILRPRGHRITSDHSHTNSTSFAKYGV